MDLINQIVERAKANKQRIVLPEGTEERTLKAADRLLADQVVDVILIGNPDEIKSLAEKHNLPFNPDYHFFEVFHFRIEATYEEIEAYAKLEEVDRIWFSDRVHEN